MGHLWSSLSALVLAALLAFVGADEYFRNVHLGLAHSVSPVSHDLALSLVLVLNQVWLVGLVVGFGLALG